MGAPLLLVTPPPGPDATGPAHRALTALVDAHVAAAARTGAHVTVLRFTDAAGAGAPSGAPSVLPAPEQVTVRTVPVATPDAAALQAALAEHAADLLGAAAVVHVHGLVLAAAVAALLPDRARLLVSEHLTSLRPLVATPVVAGLPAAVLPALRRADVLLVPSGHLALAVTRRLGTGGPAPAVEVLPYPLVPPAAAAPGDPGGAAPGTLPAVRWWLLGPCEEPGTVLPAAEAAVRAFAADVAAGAGSTLTAVEGGPALAALAADLGAGDRLRPAGRPGDPAAGVALDPHVDVVVDLDPGCAADPALPAALAAGVPALLARPAGAEPLLDEVAAGGRLRLLPPGAGPAAVLEALGDLRRALADGAPGAVPLWRAGPDAFVRRLAALYGEAVTGGAAATRGPRVLVVDLTGADRAGTGRIGRWVAGTGGEAVVVTAGAPPPCAQVPGVVTVDLRALVTAGQGLPEERLRRRLPRPARPVVAGAARAYRALRPAATVVDAALTGPLAPGSGPDARFDAVVAADADGAELARRWTGAGEVLPADLDTLIAALSRDATSCAVVAGPPAQGR